MPELSTAQLIERLEGRFAARSGAAAESISEERWAYRQAAAVLTSFQFGTLRPVTIEPSDRLPAAILRDDVVEAPGERASGTLMLKTSVRREALSQLGTREKMLEALAFNSTRPQSKFQELFERWLRDEQPPLEQQSYLELTWSGQIVSWLEGLLPGLPAAGRVRELSNRRSVYALFEHLATESFTGREAELTKLREFMGVLPPSTLTDALLRQLREWVGTVGRKPLVVEGLGGIGKSALLARFLNEHLNVENERRFPFAYLALDSPSLRVEEPFTLLAECFRQLQLLHGDHTVALEKYSRNVGEYRLSRDQLDEKANTVQTRGARTDSLMDAEELLYYAFAELINDLSHPTTGTPELNSVIPFLLVLDTFEEAIFRGADRLIGLARLLRTLHRECPGFRLVVSMRQPFNPAAFPGLRFEPITLKELESRDARNLLIRLGVTDPKTAEAIAAQIGGNPLNLQLAARLAQSEVAGTRGIQGLRTSSLFYSVSDEIIRGQLYARLLDHIHDERVRALAHPGMVLRKVTPEVVLYVLNDPCGVKIRDYAEAAQLCEELAREHTLVERDSGGGVRFRPDIRGPTLQLLRQDRPAQVRAIHEAAVRYYASRQTIPDRAEELYHRLALDEDPERLTGLWDSNFAQFLGSAVNELPPRAHAWLASKLGFDPSPEVRQRAELGDWEAFVGRRVRDSLRYGRAEAALRYLSERRERSANSPLYAYEAKALTALERFDKAGATLRIGIESMSAAPNRGRVAELLWLQSQISAARGAVEDADRSLVAAERIAERIADPLCLLQILVQRLLLRHGSANLPEPPEPIRERLATHLRGMRPEHFDRERSLARAAITLLGPSYAKLFIDVLTRTGFPPQAWEQFRRWPRNEENGLGERLRNIGSLEGVLHYGLENPALLSSVLELLEAILSSLDLSLGASNLAGIDEYREPWETELATEAV